LSLISGIHPGIRLPPVLLHSVAFQDNPCSGRSLRLSEAGFLFRPFKWGVSLFNIARSIWAESPDMSFSGPFQFVASVLFHTPRASFNTLFLLINKVYASTPE
jgi:hypothetical protein